MLAAEYINQIKESGSYDDSTIIIMTDHGTGRNAQPIFFMKEPHETHDVMQENNAPITYEELMPTIVELLGEDYSVFGQSFHEFKQDEVRHRVFYDRTYDTEYPDVKRYDGMQEEQIFIINMNMMEILVQSSINMIMNYMKFSQW